MFRKNKDKIIIKNMQQIINILLKVIEELEDEKNNLLQDKKSK